MGGSPFRMRRQKPRSRSSKPRIDPINDEPVEYLDAKGVACGLEELGGLDVLGGGVDVEERCPLWQMTGVVG